MAIVVDQVRGWKQAGLSSRNGPLCRPSLFVILIRAFLISLFLSSLSFLPYPSNLKQGLGFALSGTLTDEEGAMRKQIGIIVFLALGLTMAGCGTGSPGSGNINGTWVATLSNSAYSFSTTFTQSSGSGISVTNFTFTSTAPCFASDATAETGSFTLMGNSNGNVTGSFGMTITTELSGINSVLTLIGT